MTRTDNQILPLHPCKQISSQIPPRCAALPLSQTKCGAVTASDMTGFGAGVYDVSVSVLLL